MVREGYKEVTALGKEYIIPEEWNLTELNEILTIIRNGSSKKQNKQGEGLPVSRIETIADGTINYNKIGYVDVKPEDLNKHELKKGDILFSHINSIAHIGKVAQYKADKKLYHGMNLLKLRFDNKKVTNQFMLHRFKSTNAKHFYERYAKQAVNQASLNQNDVGLYTFPLPPLSEQKKIASILSSVDKSIEKTDEVIEKTKELKKGLMQELLTKGIGHIEFKDTQFGKIPKSWRIKPLNKIADITGGNTPRRSTEEYWGGNIPWLTPSQLTGEIINEISKTDEYITEEGFENSSVKLLPVGTVMLTSRATIGETVINKVPMTTNQGFANIICEEDKLFNYFVLYLLRYLTPKLEALAGGSTFLEISRTSVRSLNIPVPPLQEQKKIASILSSVDAKIKKQEEYKAKLERLKKGLMQKLLTGEIRVNTEMEV